MRDDVPKIVDSLSACESGRHGRVNRDNDKYNAAQQKKMTQHDCWNCFYFGAKCDPRKARCWRKGERK